jgi:hypothetical protein
VSSEDNSHDNEESEDASNPERIVEWKELTDAEEALSSSGGIVNIVWQNTEHNAKTLCLTKGNVVTPLLLCFFIALLQKKKKNTRKPTKI